MSATIKAISDNIIDVLVPYSGPFDGVDSQGDYFTPQTDFSMPGLPDLPRPVFYAHGVYDDIAEQIGAATAYRDAPEGRWYTCTLDRTSKRARQCLESLQAGKLRASSQALASFVRSIKDKIGKRITQWPIVELTLIDTRQAGHRPANPFAMVSAAKAEACLASVGLCGKHVTQAHAMASSAHARRIKKAALLYLAFAD